ncbi:EAL domain-containing protein [Luteimonas pelagia]
MQTTQDRRPNAQPATTAPRGPVPAAVHALAHELLTATTPADVAQAVLRHAGPDARVLWATDWPGDLDALPPGDPAALRHAVAAALEAHRAGDDADAEASVGMRVLHDDGRGGIAVLQAPRGVALPPEARALAGARLGEVLAAQERQATIARLEQAEQLQRALYAIADLAGSDLDMDEMLRHLHRIVAELMYAENFYIALYDKERDSLRFLYYVDMVDESGPVHGQEFRLADIERGLSWHLVRGRRPLMGRASELATQVDGPLHLHGADSFDWLGVPMLRDGEVQGMLVVQSYEPIKRYTRGEMSLLSFVAEHVLTALERRRGRDALEQQVRERTARLADTNQELQRQVAERQRGELLQAALYRIAALAGGDADGETDKEAFYREVHAVIGGLIDARNFFVALLSDDGRLVSFPYAEDAFERDWSPRASGRGLTEYVLRTNAPLRIGPAEGQALVERGEIAASMVGTPTRAWLGVPLPGDNGPMGAIVVQSYESEDAYDQGDVELLTFVASQVANSLQRRRAAELLRRANADLERRVEVRTTELREQIAERERIEAQLQHQVMHDALTGLPNRRYLHDRIERALARVRRGDAAGFGLLYVDVDRFKLLNDSLGHGAGDTVLEEVARRLASCVREPDVVARLAGDEFAILLEHVQMPETATKVAQRVLASMSAPLEAGGRRLQVSASIGITIVDASYTASDQVLHDADIALYRAKDAGRGRFELYDEAMQHSAMDALETEQALRRAIDADEFEPWLQPVVRLSDRTTIGYEALVRWRDPARGLLAPGEFLGVAEDSGLIEAIDWKMYAAAMRGAAGLVTGDACLSLNVSPRMFRYDDFSDRLLALAKDTDFSPARLRLEVTEGTLLREPTKVVDTLHRLDAAGVGAALDDFGTGYSSLSHVHRFPLRAIKIDRSFTAALDSDPRRATAMIEAILALGRALDIEIVAEGVETETQHDALVAMGCTCGQGFLYGRPQPVAHWQALRDA